MLNKVEFKAWNGQRMISWAEMRQKPQLQHLLLEQSKKIKLLQYVQAKDIKGKKIFEGHIIQSIKYGTKYIVEDIIEFQLWCNSNSIDTHLSHKIVGSIYQR